MKIPIITPNFIALSQLMCEKSVTIFLHSSVFWRPRGTALATVHQYWLWCRAYSKSIRSKLPNFIPFWKLLYKISAAEFRRFRRRRDRHTKNTTRKNSSLRIPCGDWNISLNTLYTRKIMQNSSRQDVPRFHFHVPCFRRPWLRIRNVTCDSWYGITNWWLSAGRTDRLTGVQTAKHRTAYFIARELRELRSRCISYELSRVTTSSGRLYSDSLRDLDVNFSSSNRTRRVASAVQNQRYLWNEAAYSTKVTTECLQKLVYGLS